MKQFKIIGYFIATLLLMLISCAEEGHYRLGKLEYDIKVSQITPTTAVASVKIPQNADNLIENNSDRWANVTLLERHPTNGEVPSLSDGIHTSLISEDTDGIRLFFNNLTPNTTYYVVLGVNVNYNGQSDSKSQTIITDYSFTTAKSGDYSALGEVKCDLIYKSSDITKVKFKLPEGIYFPAGQFGDGNDIYAVKAYASTSPDMSNAVESMEKHSFNMIAADEFCFKGLENTTYYFQLRGSFYTSIASEYYDRDYFWKGITLDAVNSLDLKVPEDVLKAQLECQLAFKGENFTILRVTVPGHMNTSIIKNCINKVLWSTDSQAEAIECNFYYTFDLDENYSTIYDYSSCYVSIPCAVKTGQENHLTVYGDFSENGYYRKSECTSTFVYNNDTPLIPNPNCSIDFSGIDYSVVQIHYPSEIWANDQTIIEYSISTDQGDLDSYKDTGYNGYVEKYTIVRSSSKFNQFLTVKGDFWICGLEFKNAVIYVDGKIGPVNDGERIFDVSSHQVDNGLDIIISCHKDFDIQQWVPLEYSCTSNSDNNEFVFGGSLDYYGEDAIVDNKIVLSVNSEKTEKLKKNENYRLTISGINLIYKGEFYLNGSYDKFNIEWTYK